MVIVFLRASHGTFPIRQPSSPQQQPNLHTSLLLVTTGAAGAAGVEAAAAAAEAVLAVFFCALRSCKAFPRRFLPPLLLSAIKYNHSAGIIRIRSKICAFISFLKIIFTHNFFLFG